MSVMRYLVVFLMSLFASAALAQGVAAQNLTIVVPYTPGGSTDIAIRILQPKLSALLGQ